MSQETPEISYRFDGDAYTRNRETYQSARCSGSPGVKIGALTARVQLWPIRSLARSAKWRPKKYVGNAWNIMHVFCGAKFSPVVSIRGQVNDPTRSYKNGAVFRNVADRNLLRQSIGTMTVSCRVTFTGYLHRHEKPLPKVDFNNRA